MEIIKTSSYVLLLINLVVLTEAVWTAEGRVGVRFYKDEATSFIEEPMENGLNLFESPHYNKSLPIVIIVHGMDASVDCEFVEGSVKALFYRKLNRKFNIFALNLPELLAKQSIYDKFLYTTAKNSEIAGNAIGDFLNKVIEFGFTTPDQIYVVGYSMGAQVSGYLARKIKQAHGLIKSIVGLDPAGIGFTAATIASWFTRLIHVNAEDATYTHFVHCNSFGWGTLSRNATANFIFNGGSFQPGCMSEYSNVACSHNRIPFYFIESVLYPTRFPAQRCSSWKAFAACECTTEDVRFVTFPPDLNANGIYHLYTNGHSSFGQGLDGIRCLKNRPKEETMEKKEDHMKEKEENKEENLKEHAKHRTIRDQSSHQAIRGMTLPESHDNIEIKEIVSHGFNNHVHNRNRLNNLRHKRRRKHRSHTHTKYKNKFRLQ